MQNIYLVCLLTLLATVNGRIINRKSDVTCPENTDDGFPAFLPDPENCELYYICLHGEPKHQICPDGLWFDPTFNVCNWPDQVGNKCPGIDF